MPKAITWLLFLISMSGLCATCFAEEDPHYLEYKRADGSSEYYGDAAGNRVTREQYIEIGKAQIQSMQNNVVTFAQNNQAAADSYGEDESKKIMTTQAGVVESVVDGLEKSKKEFEASIQKHESAPTFQKVLVSIELNNTKK